MSRSNPHTPQDLNSAAQGAGALIDIRPYRRWLVPSILATGLAFTIVCGAYGLMVAYQPQRLELDERHPLDALQPLLPGQQLQVPDQTGLWAAALPGAHMVLTRARADGPAQTVNLCHQHSGGGGDALSLYPMALVAGLPLATEDKAVRTRTARNPIVLPASLAPGLPTVWVQGRLAERSQPARLLLRVAPTGPGPRTWQVGMAVTQPVAGSQIGETYELGTEAWLMWSAPSSGSSTIRRAVPALMGDTPRYAWGVRIRRVAVMGCASGGLAWQLFTAQGLSANDETGTLWVLPTNAGIEARPMRLPVRPGLYKVPTVATAALEDRQLFEQALQAGQIAPLPDGRVGIASADAARHPLLKALYRSANGDHVRAQVLRANQARHWLALRLRAVDGQPLPVASEPTLWRATESGELLTMQHGMPAVAARLHTQLLSGWSEWARVLASQAQVQPGLEDKKKAGPPLTHQVQLTIPVSHRPVGDASPRRLQLMVLGQVVAVRGAQVLAEGDACTGPGCALANMLRVYTLELTPDAAELTLTLVDQPLFNRLNPSATEQLRVQWRGNGLAWVDPPEGAAPSASAADVTVLARDGTTLFAKDGPTDLTRQLGLVPLVGLASTHGHSLAGILARLGSQGHVQVVATTTFEPVYQATLHAVLACQGQADGRWLAAEQRCQPAALAPWADPRRVTAATLIDAHTGAVLASVSGMALPSGMSVQELLAFDAFNPGGSPLKVPALQHEGGAANAPGSAFKVVDALMLESLAQRSPSIAELLRGLPVGTLDSRAKADGKAFASASACYPAPCTNGQVQVQNFDGAPASRYAVSGQIGLTEAMRHSVNTWFALTAEQADKTAAAGHADARPLGQEALLSERPLLRVLDQLGLTESLHLDGGVLPSDHRWLPGDVLHGSATKLDPIIDVHNIRQQALGLRMQTTPLQMARVAAAVATGRAPPVYLLQQVNGTVAQPLASPPLNIPLSRVQMAMQEVVRAGTAAGAFAAPSLHAVKHLVHGKTGSAPLANRNDDVPCKRLPTDQAVPLSCLNNAWFIGYLVPGALPGETRTLAFAVQVSHTRRTGGAQAAPVVASWMETLWAQRSRANAASR